MNLQDKNIILTGGSLGIGKETAKLLVEKGANVLITGRSDDRLVLAKKYSGAETIKFDMSDIDNLSKNSKRCIEHFDNSRIDALINNAGTGVSRKIEDLSYEDFLKVYNVNVFGLALFTKDIVPLMKKQEYGSIINIGSTASLKGYNNGSIYSSSKFALRSMTQCWQSELRKYNIRVSQINPSEVPTAFGSIDRKERSESDNKLTVKEIAHAIVSSLEMDDRGFINELNVWATNPF